MAAGPNDQGKKPNKRAPLTPDQEARFLEALELNGGHVARACKEIDIWQSLAYRRRWQSKEFAEAWDFVEEAVWPQLQDQWLEVFGKTNSVSRACHETGLRRGAPYSLRERYPDFAAAWDSISREWIERLEGAIVRRALNGTPKVGRVAKRVLGEDGDEEYEYGVIGREHSVGREKFVLERLAPEKWGDKAGGTSAPADVAAAIKAHLDALEGAMEGAEPPQEGAEGLSQPGESEKLRGGD